MDTPVPWSRSRSLLTAKGSCPVHGMGSVRVWSVDDGLALTIFEGHRGGINHLYSYARWIHYRQRTDVDARHRQFDEREERVGRCA